MHRRSKKASIPLGTCVYAGPAQVTGSQWRAYREGWRRFVASYRAASASFRTGVGAAIGGYVLFDEPMPPARIFFLGMLVVSLAGLARTTPA